LADDGKPGSNLANGSIFIAVLATAGIYFFNHQAPLVDLRPVATDARMQPQAPTRTVEARLWQDPIAAVEKSRDKQNPQQQCQEASSDGPCKSPLAVGEKDARVLAVTVRGGSYQEDAEQRRRARYAVLAGLERAGFVPMDARHINYFLWKHDDQNDTPTHVASEMPVLSLSPLLSWWKPALNYAPQTIASELMPILPPLLITNQAGRDRDGNVLAATSMGWAIIPYEWFEKPLENNSRNEKVLVLWLKEDFLRGHPLQTLESLTHFLNRDGGAGVKVIGPFSSGKLQKMVTEANKSADSSSRGKECETPGKKKWSGLHGVKFYAYGATAPDEQLFGDLTCKTIDKYFESFGIHLQRTIATDDTLADGIIGELKRRGIKFGPDGKDRDDVALISEWDTLYGRALPEVIENKLADGAEPPHEWMHNFTYLRGLDGLLPSAASKDDTQKDKATEQEKQVGTTDFFKVEKDTQSLERPIGQSQYDYLRRISEQLHKINDGLRKHDKKIKAIGILGGDIFDKLLILRALRPEFPEALFFTTDFDEAFTIKSELPFTRNLIISSSFGPNLSAWLQGEIPYFRDTYETAAFLATQLALGEYHTNWENHDYESTSISDQLGAPRLFEVKRNGGILSFAWVPHRKDKNGAEPDKMNTNNTPVAKKDQLTQGLSVGKWLCQSDDSCGNIQPVDTDELQKQRESNPNSFVMDPKPIEKPYPTFMKYGGIALAVFFAVGAVVVRVAVFKKWIPSRRLELSFICPCLIAAAAACFFWERFARGLTGDGDGEPIALLDGTSVWPTILLRILSIILAVYFICRTRLDLDNNLQEIADDMGLNDPVPSPEQPTGAVYPDWRAYIGWERFRQRIIRAGFCTVVMLVIVFGILIPNDGMPFFAYRSSLAWYMYFGTGLLDWLLTQLLVFIVFDATCSCLLFVKKLSRAKKSRLWPPATKGVYDKLLRLPQTDDDLINEWIGLQFVAKRTGCIGKLIYYPFVLLAILILSRSTVFANYAPSLVIIVTHGISLLIVFASAIMVWLAAKSVRDIARDRLTDGIIRAKHSQDVYFAEQLQILLNRVDQLKEGAFSPLTQQPLVKAFLFPLSSAGWVALVQNGMLPGL
jgi:hypothetical protein